MSSIFIVDDSPTITTVISEILELEGHRTRSFNQAQAALESIELDPPDVILLDYHMPDISAPKFLEMLGRGGGRNPAVVILSGSEPGHEIRDLEQQGVSSYLVKPVDPSTLIGLIADLC